MPHQIAPETEDKDACDFNIEPLSFSDIKRGRAVSESSDDGAEVDSPSNGATRIFSVAMGLQMKRKRPSNKKSLSRIQWKSAFFKARSLSDPWEQFCFSEYPVEKVKRYRYNALTASWITDEAHVKIEKEPFNHGAMRRCFRMKKLSNFSHVHDWKRDCNNYVAKEYISTVEGDTYFEDVRMQMDAKLWGEEFNRHNPPKKVDIMQMAVLEFLDLPDNPLFHCEHYIEGDYVKYNSNSGFVRDDHLRLTPQAFSHFTFERSGHELIVVDIQGVGDLYTDPQVHTAAGEGYGDGNLGSKGMALFFHSHVCNSICKSLGLSHFDLHPSELDDLKSVAAITKKCADLTMARGSEELCEFPSKYDRCHLHEFLRKRSSSSGCFSESPPSSPPSGNAFSQDDLSCESEDSAYVPQNRPKRTRFTSESASLTVDNPEEEKVAFSELLQRKARPSNVEAEVKLRSAEEDTIAAGMSMLGQIHFDLAKYHELCRFSDSTNDEYDTAAALYHMHHAASCGCLDAIITLTQIYRGLNHDVLAEVTVESSEENLSRGMAFVIQAATAGNGEAMLTAAKAYDTGENLGLDRKRSWKEAMHWYDEFLNVEGEEKNVNCSGNLDEPRYLILARKADMYREGGWELEKDPNTAGELYTEAAEEAMANMKGRMANKYYMLAEEAWAECE